MSSQKMLLGLPAIGSRAVRACCALPRPKPTVHAWLGSTGVEAKGLSWIMANAEGMRATNQLFREAGSFASPKAHRAHWVQGAVLPDRGRYAKHVLNAESPGRQHAPEPSQAAAPVVITPRAAATLSCGAAPSRPTGRAAADDFRRLLRELHRQPESTRSLLEIAVSRYGLWRSRLGTNWPFCSSFAAGRGYRQTEVPTP